MKLLRVTRSGCCVAVRTAMKHYLWRLHTLELLHPWQLPIFPRQLRLFVRPWAE